MAHQLERLGGLVARRPRETAIAAVAAALLVGAALRPTSHGHEAAAAEATITVHPRPFSSSVGVVGTITPLGGKVVVAPFDGTVAELRFAYGDVISSGQVLAVMDSFDAVQRRNDAEGAYLKAQQAAGAFDHWEAGPEVSRARRAVNSADALLRSTRQRLAETKALFDRGLVARTELDGLTEQERAQTASLASATEDLNAALQQGRGAAREMADLELANAKLKLADVSRQLEGATVRAQDAGVMTLPVDDGASGARKGVHQGERVVRGQMIGLIAPTSALGVNIDLDEGDARRVHAGQAVVISQPTAQKAPVAGRVLSVAAEGIPGREGSKSVTFAAKIALDPGPSLQAADLRIGMTVNVSIMTYHRDRALVVPPQAVTGEGADARIRVLSRTNGPVRLARVTLGMSAPEELEILSGLKDGDVIIYSKP